MKFHEKIAELAESLNGMSQRDVLTRLRAILEREGHKPPGLTTVNRWFSGDGTPDIYEGAALAELFAVPVEFLSDDALDAPPLPELTEPEREVIRITRLIGVNKALHRLVLSEPDSSLAASQQSPARGNSAGGQPYPPLVKPKSKQA